MGVTSALETMPHDHLPAEYLISNSLPYSSRALAPRSLGGEIRRHRYAANRADLSSPPLEHHLGGVRLSHCCGSSLLQGPISRHVIPFTCALQYQKGYNLESAHRTAQPSRRRMYVIPCRLL